MTPTTKEILRLVLALKPKYRTDIQQLSEVMGTLTRIYRQAPAIKPALIAVQNRLVDKYVPLVVW